MCKKYTVWSSKMGGTIPYLILEDPLLTDRTFACYRGTFYGYFVAAIDTTINSTSTVHASSWVQRGQLHRVQNNGGQCLYLRLEGC